MLYMADGGGILLPLPFLRSTVTLNGFFDDMELWVKKKLIKNSFCKLASFEKVRHHTYCVEASSDGISQLVCPCSGHYSESPWKYDLDLFLRLYIISHAI